MASFDPRNCNLISSWTAAELGTLPSAEDDRHEYKSSSTGDSELAKKIARAASGFWNSGGGLFVAGVDGSGIADGGIPLAVGRQSRRDWVDQAVNAVVPVGPYAAALIGAAGTTAPINPGNAVTVVGFGETAIGPHMAPDNKYYVRAGAHTLPAGHFIVEAIRARRAVGVPVLRPILRTKSHNRSVLELRILALTDAPALGVELMIDPLPKTLDRMADKLPLRLKVVDRGNPFVMDFGVAHGPSASLDPFTVTLNYTDAMGRDFKEEFPMEPLREMGSIQIGKSEAEAITAKLEDIARAIKK
jgi:hypothetical protein